MREIKFRAWDKVLNKWNLSVEIDCFGNIQEYKYNGNCFYPKYQTFETEYSDLEKGSDRFILCQFTGLLDKNGKEIYEYDVVKILYTDWPSKSENDSRTIEEYKSDLAVKGVVMYKNCEFGLRICSDLLDSIFCGTHGFTEVVGNIYSNPELLNEMK